MTDPEPRQSVADGDDEKRVECGWCHGEGALRDAAGKLDGDCPRCRGATALPSPSVADGGGDERVTGYVWPDGGTEPIISCVDCGWSLADQHETPLEDEPLREGAECPACGEPLFPSVPAYALTEARSALAAAEKRAEDFAARAVAATEDAIGHNRASANALARADQLEGDARNLQARLASAEAEAIQLRDRTEAQQKAIDRALSALHGSAYVGGPSEREAWQTALQALEPCETEHIADNRLGGTDDP